LVATIELLVGLSLIIVISTVFALIAKRFKQPLLVAFILVGILIGPVGFGVVTNHADIIVMSELGIAFMLFAIGIESDIHKLLQMRYMIVLGALLQVFITVAVLLGLFQWAGLGFIEAVYLGLMFAFSSTVIVVKILVDQHKLDTLHGRLMVGFLLVQDAVAIIALPILANPAALTQLSLAFNFGIGLASLVVLSVVLNKLVLPHVLRYLSSSSEVFFLTIVSSCFAFILVAYLFNFSMAIGAFIGGLTLSSLAYNVEASSKIRGLRDFFSTIFFVSLGMQLTISFVAFPWLLFAIMLVAVYIINPLIFFLISLFAGYGSRTALFIGLGLGQASEFSFILASQALALGQMSVDLFNLAIIVIVLSMITTPYLMENDETIYRALRKVFGGFSPVIERMGFNNRLRGLENLPSEKKLKGHVIVFGAGIFGLQLAEALKKKYTVVAVDHNPHSVLHAMQHGIYSAYGNAVNTGLWDKINLGDARLVVLAIPDMYQAVQALKEIKAEHPKLVVFSRAQSFKDALNLYNAGASNVVIPKVLGSNECYRNATDFLESMKTIKLVRQKKELMKYIKEKALEEESGEEHHKL